MYFYESVHAFKLKSNNSKKKKCISTVKYVSFVNAHKTAFRFYRSENFVKNTTMKTNDQSRQKGDNTDDLLSDRHFR